jgi:predicted component of type VI protein secretion system
MESTQLIDWVMRNGKLASPTHLAMFVERALPGIKIERLAGQPHDIAGPPGAEYFKLEPYGDQWTEVTRQSTLALSLAALTDADVRLYIVMPGS